MPSPSLPQAHPAPDDTALSAPVCLANAELVLRNDVLRGALTIVDGKIAEIAFGGHVPKSAIDCRGDYVIPGLVELHTDNLERHIEPRPEVDWPHLPALVAHDAELAGTGITTVFDALRVGSVLGGKARYIPYARGLADELLRARAAGLFRISHFIHLRAEICSETLLEELDAFDPEDRIGVVSLMDHTPGQRQFRDMSALKAYVARKRGMSDAEFLDHVDDMRALQTRFGAAHEAGAVLAARRLGAVLASHDDTTEAQVAVSHGHGVRFAEFPTTKEAARASADCGIAVLMGAPNIIRGSSHSGNVSAQSLAEGDLLDIISSDYVPAALLLAAFRLAAVWNDLPRAIACVTARPAEVTGLTDRGSLRQGLRGDVARVALHDTTPLIRGVWSAGRRVS